VNHGKTELKVRGSAIKDDIILMKPKIPYNAGEKKAAIEDSRLLLQKTHLDS
jgi:hypothetical protein